MTSPWPWLHFSAHEIACRCCGRNEMAPEFMDLLERLRSEFARPLIVSSGFRCPAWNQKVSKSGPDGPHTTGHAADLGVRWAEQVDLVRIATNLGFTGFGVAATFIHLDDLPVSARFPRPRIWGYT